MTIPSLAEVRAQVDAEFPPERRKRALAWAQSAEGRACVDDLQRELDALPRPIDPKETT